MDRPKLIVTQDSDGGITVSDRNGSGVVLSIISTHPAGHGPQGLVVEAYGYEHSRIERQEWPRQDLRGGGNVATFYAMPERYIDGDGETWEHRPGGADVQITQRTLDMEAVDGTHRLNP